MNINDSFPSNYLKADDLQGRRHTLTISHVETEKMTGGDEKSVVYFKGKEKGLVLNKTNSMTIADVAGSPETDDWQGVKIVLYKTKAQYQGKVVDAIRVDETEQAPAKDGFATAKEERRQQRNTAPADEDDIPF